MKKIIYGCHYLLLCLLFLGACGPVEIPLEPTKIVSDNWTYRIKLTVPSANIDADLTDFPVLVNLSDFAATNFFTTVEVDFGDLVVTDSDGVTLLRREIVDLNKGGSTGELWFKAPLLSSTADSVFYIYYGNSDYNASNSTDVWSNGYAGVWHLNETGSGTAGEYEDSSPNANHGTGGSGLSGRVNTTPANAAGKIGQGQRFNNGVDTDAISFGSGSSMANLGPLTLSFWCQIPSTASVPNGRRFANKGFDAYWANPDALYWQRGFSGGDVRRYWATLSENDIWYLYTVIWDGTFNSSGITIYENTSTGSTGASDTTGTLNDDSATEFFLGNVNWAGTYDRGVDGYFDEVHYANVSRSFEWISAEHANQNDPSSFYNFEEQENLF
ncbi:MAG: hypothetical protein JW969_13260 [Spirochaetales bacterium]|nr:hypothetical protein [Spirochaetales bacterium]